MSKDATTIARKVPDDARLKWLREVVVSMVRSERPDLSARQFGVFLTCYLTSVKQTVRGLALDHKVSKPAITRALDRLEELGLIEREVDPMDRRSIFAKRTSRGAAYLDTVKNWIPRESLH